jgi:hypothetical protein
MSAQWPPRAAKPERLGHRQTDASDRCCRKSLFRVGYKNFEERWSADHPGGPRFGSGERRYRDQTEAGNNAAEDIDAHRQGTTLAGMRDGGG